MGRDSWKDSREVAANSGPTARQGHTPFLPLPNNSNILSWTVTSAKPLVKNLSITAFYSCPPQTSMCYNRGLIRALHTQWDSSLQQHPEWTWSQPAEKRPCWLAALLVNSQTETQHLCAKRKPTPLVGVRGPAGYLRGICTISPQTPSSSSLRTPTLKHVPP